MSSINAWKLARLWRTFAPWKRKKQIEMYLTTEIKKDLFEKHGLSKKKSDTGSAESQVALFTHSINHLTEHLKSNKKDFLSNWLTVRNK